MVDEYPKNLTEENMIGFVEAVFDGAKTLKEAKKSRYVDTASTVNFNMDACIKLGFVEKDSQEYSLTGRGKKLILNEQNSEQFRSSFRRGIQDFKPYRDLLIYIYDEEVYAEKEGNKVILRDSIVDKMRSYSEDASDIKRKASSAFRVFQAGGLGTLKVGRRGSKTRFVINKDQFELLEAGVDTFKSEYGQEASSDQSQDEETAGSTLSETVNASENVSIEIQISSSDWSKQEIEDLIEKVASG